jgi:hypothetical protein
LDYTPLGIADRCKELRSKFVALSLQQFITKGSERKSELSHVQVAWMRQQFYTSSILVIQVVLDKAWVKH